MPRFHIPPGRYAKYNNVLRFFSGKEVYGSDMEIPDVQLKCATDYMLGRWAKDADGSSMTWTWLNEHRYATTRAGVIS